MANFRSKDVLTVSATIIAGLLILLTIQGLSTNPVLSKAVDIQDNIQSKNIEIDSDIQTIGYLKSELSHVNDTQRSEHIQNQIDDLQMQTYQLQQEVYGLNNQAKQWTDQNNGLHIVQNIQILRFTILGMIIPFGLAIAQEASASLKHQHNTDELATTKGKKLLFAGVFIMILGLTIIFSSVWI